MRFRSTRGHGGEVSFRQAVFQGLAPDGGLYYPTTVPDLGGLFESFNSSDSFCRLAEEVTFGLLAPEINRQTAARIAKRAFTFSPKLEGLADDLYLLELYHGPSFAFKDFGASFLAACMEEFLTEQNQSAVIIVATSGDTGSAVARAFYRKENINVVILYPSGRVSQLQEKQLTTLRENIVALEVRGAFDDCQRLAKQAFTDETLRSELQLTSANSINLGRLIPQSFYYIYAYAQIKAATDSPLVFCVPSGNFGNLTAGVYAWQWGLPVEAFVAATNINDIVPEYLQTGIFNPRPSVATFSNAMDVGNPSNFERLLAVFDNLRDRMASLLRGEMVTDSDTLEAMAEFERSYGYFIDPHTAVGYLGAVHFLENGTGGRRTCVILGTAHPAKFGQTVEKATGKAPDLPPDLKRTLDLPKEATQIEPTLAALSKELRLRFA